MTFIIPYFFTHSMTTWTHFDLDMDFDCDQISSLARELGEAFNRSILAAKTVRDRVVQYFNRWHGCGTTLWIYLSDPRRTFISLTLPRDRGRLAAIYTAATSDEWIDVILLLSRHLEEEAQHFYPCAGDVDVLHGL